MHEIYFFFAQLKDFLEKKSLLYQYRHILKAINQNQSRDFTIPLTAG